MSELEQRAWAFIASHHVMTLATWAEGDLWAADVFYAARRGASGGPELLFVSSPDSRHGRHLLANGRAAATISAEATRWQDIKGVQLEGSASCLAADAVDAALAVYLARFPWLHGNLRRHGGGGQTGPAVPALVCMEIAGRQVTVPFWRLRPARLLFLDNSAGFGRRQEVFTCRSPGGTG